jgi:hypothetical protein
MTQPYDHEEVESALCSKFANPTKTCGSHWDGKTLVFNEDEAWMTDGDKTAHRIQDGTVSCVPSTAEVPQDWIDDMMDAVNSMRGRSYLFRQIDTPRYPDVSTNFRVLARTANTAMGNLCRIGDRQTKISTSSPGEPDDYIHVDTVGELTYAKKTGFHVKETSEMTKWAMRALGLGAQ